LNLLVRANGTESEDRSTNHPHPHPLRILIPRRTTHSLNAIPRIEPQRFKDCIKRRLGRISITDPHIAEGSRSRRSRLRLVQDRNGRLARVAHVHLTGVIEVGRQRKVPVRRRVRNRRRRPSRPTLAPEEGRVVPGERRWAVILMRRRPLRIRSIHL